MSPRLLMLIACALALASSVAQADEYICGNSMSDQDANIQECSRLIESGTLSGRDLARAYYSRGMTYAVGKHDEDAGVADQNKAIAADPSYDDPYVSRAAFYRRRQQFDLASADTETALRLNPQNFWAYFGRGMTYRDRGEPDRALAEWRQLADRYRDIDRREASTAYAGQAFLLEKLGRIPDAISAWQNANVLYPTDYDVEQIKRLGGQP